MVILLFLAAIAVVLTLADIVLKRTRDRKFDMRTDGREFDPWILPERRK